MVLPAWGRYSLSSAQALSLAPTTPTEVSFDVANDSITSSQLYILKQMGMLNTIWPSLSEQAAQQFPGFASVYNQVFSLKLPNFLGAQVQVPSGLNIHQWEEALSVYHDKDICSFLCFGWPLGYIADTHPVSITDNHTSATMHEKHIQKFIQTELEHQAIIGPFDSMPYTPWTRCSPMMTRPKKDSEFRRVIVDLSYPTGSDVNSAIYTTSYLGQDISWLPNCNWMVVAPTFGRRTYVGPTANYGLIRSIPHSQESSFKGNST